MTVHVWAPKTKTGPRYPIPAGEKVGSCICKKCGLFVRAQTFARIASWIAMPARPGESEDEAGFWDISGQKLWGHCKRCDQETELY